MSLTTNDKHFITSLVLGESARLEAKLTSELSRLEAKLEAKVSAESSRLETIMEDDRGVLNTCLDMLNGNLIAVETVVRQGARIYTVEQTQHKLITTVNKHSRTLKKLT